MVMKYAIIRQETIVGFQDDGHSDLKDQAIEEFEMGGSNFEPDVQPPEFVMFCDKDGFRVNDK